MKHNKLSFLKRGFIHQLRSVDKIVDPPPSQNGKKGRNSVLNNRPRGPTPLGFSVQGGQSATVRHLLGPGGGGGAPRILYVGNLYGIGQVLREHLDADVVEDIMDRVTHIPIQGKVHVRQGQPILWM